MSRISMKPKRRHLYDSRTPAFDNRDILDPRLWFRIRRKLLLAFEAVIAASS
ncbi:uncharacterized protein G2W53_012379 [Senna tora]|uniref:Uncharacterized protein n=1 Tax=Senna tora TaxID=362788 RepID=A0A834WRT5_9FABA|nr:uncharacterized protein G2W53_012379 [Senna tora]